MECNKKGTKTGESLLGPLLGPFTPKLTLWVVYWPIALNNKYVFTAYEPTLLRFQS